MRIAHATMSAAAGDRDGVGTPCRHCPGWRDGICGSIPADRLRTLAMRASIVEVTPGAPFLAEGDAKDTLFNVIEGTAKLYKLLADGRRQILGFASAGDFLGLGSETLYGFGAEAVDRLRLCRFPHRSLDQLCRELPALEQRLLRVASSELDRAREQILLLGRKTARERLASFLLAMARTGACAEAPLPLALALRLPMGRQDIADYLGLTVETVSRTFTRLGREGLITLPDPSLVLLLEPGRLSQLAGGEA